MLWPIPQSEIDLALALNLEEECTDLGPSQQLRGSEFDGAQWVVR